jgi:dTDP-4-dehydrorhamnose reductase
MPGTRVLLLGAGGMLAHDLERSAPPDVDLRVARDPAGRRLDVTDRDGLVAVLDAERPRWVVNAAGYTKVDLAERETDAALAVNATAVATLGAECAKRRISVLHYGSDYVFPGTGHRPYREDDATVPINAYGLTKLRGEEALVASGARPLIIRTQWLFGLAGRSFPRTMWERATAGMPTRVVNDQTGRPTYTRDLAQWTWRLLALGTEGIIHAANAGTATWFDMASQVFHRAGASHLLSSCATEEYPTPARRPTYSVLDTSTLERALGPVRSWQDALGEFLDEIDPSSRVSFSNL